MNNILYKDLYNIHKKMGIFRKLNLFLRCLELDYKYTPPSLKMKLILGLWTGHGIYALSSLREAHIEIKDKYIIPTYIGAEYRVITSDNKHITICQSLWYWKWNDAERWSRLEKNTHYKMNIYGYRIPILGIFPQQIS